MIGRYCRQLLQVLCEWLQFMAAGLIGNPRVPADEWVAHVIRKQITDPRKLNLCEGWHSCQFCRIRYQYIISIWMIVMCCNYHNDVLRWAKIVLIFYRHILSHKAQFIKKGVSIQENYDCIDLSILWIIKIAMIERYWWQIFQDLCHYHNIAWASQCLKSVATWHIIQQLVQANNNYSIKSLCFCGSIPGEHYMLKSILVVKNCWNKTSHGLAAVLPTNLKLCCKILFNKLVWEWSEFIAAGLIGNPRVAVDEWAAHVIRKQITDSRKLSLGEGWHSHQFCRIKSRYIIPCSISLQVYIWFNVVESL